jgi:transcriptional regulator with XRE-family HTH domain/tetratricopeptide (TPR) repeat protein
MSMPDTSRTAQVIRERRAEQGLTQQELADELVRIALLNKGRHVGVTANMVSKWERGTKHPSRFYSQLLCLVLDASPTDLDLPAGTVSAAKWHAGTSNMNPREPENDNVDRRQFFRSTAVVGATLITSRAAPTSADSPDLFLPLRRAIMGDLVRSGRPDLRRLGRRITNAWALRQEGRYDQLARSLPSLVVDARAAVHELRGAEHVKATAILVHAYNAASSVLKTIGSSPLALVAADRAIQVSAQIDSPALAAAGAYRLANVFLPAGQAMDALDVALEATSRVEPSINRSPIELATWGSLLLTAAAAAAATGDATQAWQLYGEATTASRMLGHDHADVYTIFGPTSVAMQGVCLAADLGAPRDAIRRSERITLDRLPAQLRERRSHYLVNLASGYEQCGDDSAALAYLLLAERYSPEDVHRGALPRSLVTSMLSRERRGATAGLRALAARLHVAS